MMILQYGDDLHLLPSRPRTGLATTCFIELFKITLNGDPALRRRLLDIVVRIWRGGEVPQQWSIKRRIGQSSATTGASRW